MIQYLIVISLLILSALFSGLTLGLMSLNPAGLKRKVSLKNRDAIKVYSVRKRGNLLLTTLLVGNVAVNAALSIFLGSIASGFTAGLVATGLIVIFGEITPQAILSRHALRLGAKMVWLVKTFIFILYPVCMPIAWTLNKILGEELPNIYSKKELIKIIEEHEDTHRSDLDADEERIIKGALTFSDKIVKDVMTPLTVVQMFEASTKIDKSFIGKLEKSGHSRIPIFKTKQDTIIGILYLKQLLGEKNLGQTAGTIADKNVQFINENKKLDITFNTFLKTRYHLFIVTNSVDEVVGIITLEDILEEIIRSEIVDETDKHTDLRKVAKEKKSKLKQI